MNPVIIHEHQNYLVINKPAGLMVHGDGRSTEKTLCDFLLEQYPEIAGVGEPITLTDGGIIVRPGIVHRLDKDTSGVMLVARTAAGFAHLKAQFQARTIQKTYHAFVYGNIKNDTGVIDAPIGHSRADFRQWTSGKNARGEIRDAVTEFSVLARATDKQCTFIEAHPKTGRTHQIRVHFKFLNNPVVSDALYAPGRAKMLGFERLALHARRIEFTDMTGATVSFEAEYPEDFKHALQVFETEK